MRHGMETPTKGCEGCGLEETCSAVENSYIGRSSRERGREEHVRGVVGFPWDQTKKPCPYHTAIT